MAPPPRDDQILLNGVAYSLVEGSYKTLDRTPRPATLREGSPGAGTDDDNDVVGWNDWSEGGFAVTYDPRDPARIGTVKNLITDVPYQITLSYLQQDATGVDEAPTKIAQLVAGARMVAISATKVLLKDDGVESWTAKLTGVTPTDIVAWGDGTNTLYLVAMGNATAYRYTTGIDGTKQVETATVVGTITGPGNATVIVTASGMSNSPKTVSVAVALNDDASAVAGKIRTALAADSDVNAFFAVSGSGADVVVTRRTGAANDATMNVSVDNGTCTGLTAAPTSADTTAGVAVAWTTSNLGAGGNAQYANFFAVGSAATGTSGGTLWKAVKPNLVYASSNPKNGGAWTSAYTVGGSETNITGLAVIEDRLLVAKEEGIYWVQPDGTVQLLIDLRQAISASNGSAMIGWGGYIFVNWLHELGQLSGRNLLNIGELTGSFRDIGPHVGNQEAGDVRGRVVAMCGSPTRLYVVLRSESDNYSINRYNGNPVPGHGWNPGFLWLGSTACNALGWEQPTTGNPRLYFGYGAGIRFCVMPRWGDNPLLDSSCSFCPSGTAELPEHESPYRAMTKSMLYNAVDAERLSAGSIYVDVAYKLDDDGVIGWSTLGRFETAGLASKYFSTTENGRRIKLQLTLASTDSTNTPRLRLLEHHYELRPELRRRWQFQVKAGPTASHPTRTTANTITLLEAARSSSNPVSFVDRFGSTWDAFLETIGSVEYTKLPGDREPTAVVALSCKEYKSGVGNFYVGDENALVDSAYAA